MTKKGLVVVEEKYYTSCKQMCVDSITSQKVKSPETYQKIIDSLNGLSEDEVKQYAITLKMTPAEVKAMNNGTIKALEEVLNTYSEYFSKCIVFSAEAVSYLLLKAKVSRKCKMFRWRQKSC